MRCSATRGQTARRPPPPAPSGFEHGAPSLLGNRATARLLRGSLVTGDEGDVADVAEPEVPEPEPLAEVPENAAAPVLIVDDEAESVEAGQMRKSEFLDRLRPEVQAVMPDPSLVDTAFREYQAGDAARLQEDLLGFIPEAREVTTAEDAIPLIVARAAAMAAHEDAHASVPGAAPEASEPLTGDAEKTEDDGGRALSPLLALLGCGKSCPEPAKPPRLTFVANKKLLPGDPCGNFSWGVQWKLSEATAKGGWVVQHVETTFDIKDCNGKQVDVKALTSGDTDPANWPLWEAWQIGRCETGTGKLIDDSYTMCLYTEPPNVNCGGHNSTIKTSGRVEVKGTAEFFDGLSLPKDFVATGKPPTGSLPITRTAPTLAGGTGSLDHSAIATWDCCEGNDHNTKVKTSSGKP